MHSEFRAITVASMCVLMLGCSTTVQGSGATLLSGTKSSATEKSDSNSVRVRGVGATCDDALRNGFLMAAQQKIGSVVSSSRDVLNSQLKIDEILDYSSGYVERYVIHSRYDSAGQCGIDMTVWVLDSRIARRILGSTRGNESVDGIALASSYDSFKRSVDNADSLLRSVFRDFPRRAFEITQSQYRVRFDSSRTPVLEIPYTVSWNTNYVGSLRESLHYASLNKGKVAGKPYDPSIDNKLSRDFIYNYSTTEYHGRVIMDATDYFIGSIFYIPDVEHYRLISSAFTHKRRPMLATEYFDHDGKSIREKMFCSEFDPRLNFVSTDRNVKRLEINTQKSFNYVLSVWLDEHTIRNLTRVELSVMAAEDCPRIAKQ